MMIQNFEIRTSLSMFCTLLLLAIKYFFVMTDDLNIEMSSKFINFLCFSSVFLQCISQFVQFLSLMFTVFLSRYFSVFLSVGFCSIKGVAPTLQ